MTAARPEDHASTNRSRGAGNGKTPADTASAPKFEKKETASTALVPLPSRRAIHRHGSGKNKRGSTRKIVDRIPDELAGSLPSRRALLRLRRKGRLEGLFGRLAAGASRIPGRLRQIRRANSEEVLGYVPLGLFLGLSFVTLGLYPYIWTWGNAAAFVKIAGKRLDERRIRRFAVLGFSVQLLFCGAALAALWGFAANAPQAYEQALPLFLAYAALWTIVVLPPRCFHHFALRWNLRRSVLRWDNDALMLDRTMNSWMRLFLLGSPYIQHHVNRLMGLGMPGFSDADELPRGRTPAEWIRDYLTAGRESGGRSDG